MGKGITGIRGLSYSSKLSLRLQSNPANRSAKLERHTSPKSQRATEIKENRKNYCGNGFILRFICYRQRLLDLSNLSVKWIEDALVTHNIIPDDNPEIVKKIEFFQFKAKIPKTIILIFEIDKKEETLDTPTGS